MKTPGKDRINAALARLEGAFPAGQLLVDVGRLRSSRQLSAAFGLAMVASSSRSSVHSLFNAGRRQWLIWLKHGIMASVRSPIVPVSGQDVQR